jgi:hypothetical protein
MTGEKIFQHIEWFYDDVDQTTVILFAVDATCEHHLFDNKKYVRVEMCGLRINVESIPYDSFESFSEEIGKKLLWLRCYISGPKEKFVKCKCVLYKGDKKLGEKNIAYGYKFRSRVFQSFKLYFKNIIKISILCFFRPQPLPIVSLHLWHLDIAMDILQVFKETSRFFELRLAIPDNLDAEVTDQLLQHVDKNYHFTNVTTVVVPAVGRDIGGLIASLLHSIQNTNYKFRPHLFIHTKNTPHLDPLLVRRWRNSLIHDIANEVNFCISLLLFKYFKASIVYALSNDRIEDGNDNIYARQKSYELAKAVSSELFNSCNDKIRFCAGTMMWVMPARVEKVWSIEKLQAVLSKLEPSPTMQEPSHAHAFERLFPDIARRSGLKVFRI